MTVQEFIEKLNEVEDKSIPLYMSLRLRNENEHSFHVTGEVENVKATKTGVVIYDRDE